MYRLDIIDISDITNPVLADSIELDSIGGGVNSVAIYNGILALAVENDNKQANGFIVFYNTQGQWLNKVEVGALPDMVTFSPNGQMVLSANEGEPDDDYNVDPEGSVSIIDISNGVENATVNTLGFTAYNGTTLDASIRVFGPNATVAQDFEPEYITVSADSKTAYVALQENNALAIIDLDTETITAIKGLGFKDHSLAANALDPSNRDDAFELHTFDNLFGMYQPDAISSFQVNGQTYVISANEGDSRDYDGFSEEDRVKDLTLDPTNFPNAAALQENEILGRLNITNTLGDNDNDGDFDSLFAYGARSFSIWDATGNLVYDSGDDFAEQILASSYADYFNSNNDENESEDSRSDDKGAEPEAVEVVSRNGRIFAFIGLERIGGVMIYDVTDPTSPFFINYYNSRNFEAGESIEDNLAATGDSGPEDVLYISRDDSPSGDPLLVVSYEVTGTIGVYKIGGIFADNTSPSLTITSEAANNTTDEEFDVIFTFSEKSINFELSDITVSGGTLSNLQTSDSIFYTATLTTTLGTPVQIDVAANVATDLAGNGNTAATQFTIITDLGDDFQGYVQKQFLFPNPIQSNGLLFSKKAHTFTVMNAIGQTVLQTGKTKQIDMSQLPNGLYFIVNEQLEMQKVLK